MLTAIGIVAAYGVLATFSFCIGNPLDSQRGVPFLASTSWGMYACCSWQSLPLRGHPLHHRHVAACSFSLVWLIFTFIGDVIFARYLSLTIGSAAPPTRGTVVPWSSPCWDFGAATRDMNGLSRL